MKRVWLLCVCLLSIGPAVAWASPAPLTSTLPVRGTFTTQVVPCASLCTESEYAGDLEGWSEFSLSSLEPTCDPEVSRYTGNLVIHTADGDLIGHDAGTWNTTTGEYTDTYQITGGTGVYEGATGTLRLWGTLDPLTGTGASHYRGKIRWTS